MHFTIPVLFVCIRVFFFFLFTSSAYIIIRSKLFILVLFLIEIRKSIYRTVKPEGRLK